MKIMKAMYGLALGVMCLTFLNGKTAYAQESVLPSGVYFDGVDYSGKSREQAISDLEEYVRKIGEKKVTLVAAENNTVEITMEDLGISWSNSEIVDEALNIGSIGTPMERYKIKKDLEQDHVDFEVKYDFDINAIDKVLANKCAVFDKEAKDATLTRQNGQFVIENDQVGYLLDVESSIDLVYDALQTQKGEEVQVVLDVFVDEPKAKASDFAQMTDILGTYTTSFSSSNSNRSGNVTNGCRLINGTLLLPGEEFSTYNTVAPFSTANGYFMAGSYMNGKVVDSLGGGICQVSTTLYNAVLLAELDVTERHNHSMIVSYVSPSADAAIAESAGKDFRFVNNTGYPIYIEGIIKDKTITFNIYGKETRSSNREVTYESKVLETINPTSELLYANEGQPIGYVARLESAHVGKKAQLWKIVKENGVEVSRTQVNSSNYKMSPASYSVGVATSNPEAYNAMIAAINSGHVDTVRATAAAYTAPPPAPAE